MRSERASGGSGKDEREEATSPLLGEADPAPPPAPQQQSAMQQSAPALPHPYPHLPPPLTPTSTLVITGTSCIKFDHLRMIFQQYNPQCIHVCMKPEAGFGRYSSVDAAVSALSSLPFHPQGPTQSSRLLRVPASRHTTAMQDLTVDFSHRPLFIPSDRRFLHYH